MYTCVFIRKKKEIYIYIYIFIYVCVCVCVCLCMCVCVPARVSIQQLYINREESPVITDENTDNYSVFSAKYGNFQSEATKHFGLFTNLQVANSFGKVSSEISYRKLFENNRQITLRMYAGAFLYKDTSSEFFSFGLDRPTDYLFEYNLLGRSEATGLYSQQYVPEEGGFKSQLETRFANQWITTINASFNIWNWVQIYGDVGMLKNKFLTAIEDPFGVAICSWVVNILPSTDNRVPNSSEICLVFIST